MTDRMAYGGKTIYGARVGILMLDTRWPRGPGDTGNAATWPFPVLYKVVRGATAKVVIHEKGKGLNQAFLDAADELVRDGADGIATTGGFLSIFQKELADHCNVPVASSSLMQIPLAQNLLPTGKRVGVITIQGERLGPDHLIAAGAPGDTPVVGTEKGQELTRVLLGDQMELDYGLAEEDMLAAGEELMSKHSDIGAIVFECHNMAPFSRVIATAFNVPVYDVYTFVTWFHAGIAPRDFGHPSGGSWPRGWRER